MIEIWKDIPGYEGKYQASNLGRIKGLERKFVRKTKGTTTYKEKVFTPQINMYGYHVVCLSMPPSSVTKTVHRLVALAFLKSPLNRAEQVNHIDGIKTNNIISNLELCTQSENIKHAYKLELIKRKKGELSSKSVVNNRDVIHIRDDKLKSKMTTRVAIAKIASGYNISHSLADKICFRTKWKHV